MADSCLTGPRSSEQVQMGRVEEKNARKNPTNYRNSSKRQTWKPDELHGDLFLAGIQNIYLLL